MGDFAAPAAAANGSSICINNNLNSSLSGAGIGVSSTPHGPAAAGNNTASSGGIPKHSTVVERLRQRIEGCRRHHVNCESRYQQAQAEQLELERRDTVSLYQRTLEQRAKKTGSGGSKQQHPSKQQQDAEPAPAEQRNHTLIMFMDPQNIIGSVFRSTAIVTVKDQSAKDDEENISSIQSSPKKSAGHSMDSYQEKQEGGAPEMQSPEEAGKEDREKSMEQKMDGTQSGVDGVEPSTHQL
ncbi:Mastermind-like protein 3 [Turdus rufiventris]|nr:Mastermind-like protein 3 [Turdus rufiventris]